MAKSVVKIVTDLTPVVSGGDGTHSHVMVKTLRGFTFVPRLHRGMINLALLTLSVVLFAATAWMISQSAFIDGLICGLFSLGLFIFGTKGHGVATISVNVRTHKNPFIGSMSGKGNCGDNAVAESVFGTKKVV